MRRTSPIVRTGPGPIVRSVPAPRTPLDADLGSPVVPAPRPSEDRDDRDDDRGEAAHHLLGVSLELYPSPHRAAVHALAGPPAVRGFGVFTCNVDHLMRMRVDPAFRRAYQHADMVTVDGAPVALLARLTGTQPARRVTGVDLTDALIELAAQRDLRVALVGGAPGHAVRAAANIGQAVPRLPEVLALCPRMGFEIDDDDDARLIAQLRRYHPSIVIVCLGAPKQEFWIDHHRDELPGAVLVGAGSTIDYLSGSAVRAPAFFQRTGTESLYRLVTDFPRLWRRYLVRDARFFVVFAVALLGHLVGRIRPSSGRRSHPVGGRVFGSSCAACAAMLAAHRVGESVTPIEGEARVDHR